MEGTSGLVKVRHLCLGLPFILCLTFVRTALSQEGTLQASAICSIARSPEKYDNRVVKVRAGVFSDGNHGTILHDESCDSFGMHLFVVPGSKGEDELDAALNWCHRSTRGKIISGTFTGMFHFKPGSPPEHSISVQRIEGLVLKSTKTASASFPAPCPEAPPLDTLLRESGHSGPPNQK